MYTPPPPQLSIWQSDTGDCIIVTQIDGPPTDDGYFVWFTPYPFKPELGPDDDEVAHASLWERMLETLTFVAVAESTYD